MAVQKLYDFIWDIFCDWYIEIAKIRLNSKDETKEQVQSVLVYVLSGTLKLLHPFMPFITEEIWQALPHEGESIMVSPWPTFKKSLSFRKDEAEMQRIIQAIRAIRNRRAEMNVPPSKKSKLYIESAYVDTFSKAQEILKRLAWASEVSVNEADLPDGLIDVVTSDAKISIPLGDLIDFAAEKVRLERELEESKKMLDSTKAKLSNPGFINNAPEKVVEKQRQMASSLEEKISMIEESLAKLP